jgi:deoxyribonuclease-4
MAATKHISGSGPLIGAHFSTAGGAHHALEQAAEFHCPVAQLFTSSPRQWKGTKIADETVAKFLALQKETGVIVASHASYLINLAGEGEFGEKSRLAFSEELVRCQALNIPMLVIHPGTAPGSPETEGIRRIAGSLDIAYEDSGNTVTSVLLETTAGSGHSIGSKFEHLAQIIDQSRSGKRLGVCLDTCHVFAAGYDLRTEETYAKTMDDFKSALPFSRLRFFHFNDSVTGLNSHVDRHAHLGEGKLGLDPFRLILQDPRFDKVGKCLETEPDEKRVADLDILRKLA